LKKDKEAVMSSTEISKEAVVLLRDLAVTPQVVGYDFLVKELDEAKPRLIEWLPGVGYFASAAGHALLERLQDAAVATRKAREGKHPVAFRMYHDGAWLLYESEEEIEKHASMCGVDYQGLYVRDGT
jgi:hypothetical protein